jgi:acyl phosphate:glycerol-3-phosphate acyltransferase
LLFSSDLLLRSNLELRAALVIIIAYLLGSIPFGYLIVRLREGGDIRKTGSGGTGATNVSRRAGKVAGILTLLLDAMKGAAAVVIAKAVLGLPIFESGEHTGPPLQALTSNVGPHLQSAYWWVSAAAVAVIVGHMFPVWLRFRGGKGVATGLGVFLVLAPIAVGLAAVIFVLTVAVTRYVSLGSILAVATIPLFVLLQDRFIRPVADLMSLITAASTGAILIIFVHRENIARLIQGTESKFK